MPTSKKPRKKYSPKTKVLRLMSRAHHEHGQRPLATDAALSILAVNHDAMASLTRGEGSQHHWEVIASALFFAGVMDRDLFGSAYADDFIAARSAHAACGLRMFSTGRPVYRGPEMQAINDALAIHDEQIRLATQAEMERVLAYCKKHGQQPTCDLSPIAQVFKAVEAKLQPLTC